MARLLVVDDATFIRHILVDLLTTHGHEVVGQATNGNEAVAQFRLLRPDVVTLDITMPEKDGIEALREIMAEDPAARVIVCSALKEKTRVIEALQAGARDYILKPLRPERVLESVEKVLLRS